MTNFWPLFTDIKSLKFDSATFDWIQCEHFDLAAPLLSSARILHTELFFTVIKAAADNVFFISIFSYYYPNFWFCDWLQTPREDGKPRILVLSPIINAFHDSSSLLHLIRRIKKV
jgi:hypothetical protein